MDSVIREFWLKHLAKNIDEIIGYVEYMAAILLIMRTYPFIRKAMYAALCVVILAVYVFYVKFIVRRTKKKYLKQHSDYKALYISGMTEENQMFFLTQTPAVFVVVLGIIGFFVNFQMAKSVARTVNSVILFYVSIVLSLVYVALYFIIQKRVFQQYFFDMLGVKEDELSRVSQEYPLIDEYTAVENVALPIRIKHNMPRETAVHYAGECMKELLLSRMSEIKACELTNMQRVEVMVARIYVCEGWDITVSDELMYGLTHIEKKSVSMLLDRAKKIKRRVIDEAKCIDGRSY